MQIRSQNQNYQDYDNAHKHPCLATFNLFCGIIVNVLTIVCFIALGGNFVEAVALLLMIIGVSGETWNVSVLYQCPSSAHHSTSIKVTVHICIALIGLMAYSLLEGLEYEWTPFSLTCVASVGVYFLWVFGAAIWAFQLPPIETQHPESQYAPPTITLPERETEAEPTKAEPEEVAFVETDESETLSQPYDF